MPGQAVKKRAVKKKAVKKKTGKKPRQKTPEKARVAAAARKSPVRAPQQNRSEQTFNRILKAVTKLVAKGAYDDATVSEITRQAKCSVGAFYGRFSDKDAALFAMYDARCEKLEAMILPIFEEGLAKRAPLAKTLSRFVDCLIDHTFANAAFIRAQGFLSSAKSSEPFWARAKEMNGAFYNALHQLLVEKKGEMSHSDPKTAALITLSIVGGLPRDAVKTGVRLVDPGIKSASAYKAEIRRVVLGYLGAA